ncbi:MAG: hypothetical protein ACRD5H_10410 [Nitrososphaerales archaeon]
MIGREEDDKLEAEQILIECRKYKGPVLIRKTGANGFRFVVYGLPAEAWITKKWRIARVN